MSEKWIFTLTGLSENLLKLEHHIGLINNRAEEL